MKATKTTRKKETLPIGRLNALAAPGDRRVSVSFAKLDKMRQIVHGVLDSLHDPKALRKARRDAMTLVMGGIVFTLGACAATVGSDWTQTHEKIGITNGSPATTTASISNGDKFASNGHGPASLTRATGEDSQEWANGATPTNLFTQRKPDGTTSFSFFGAADRSIEAEKFSFDPATGMVQGENVKIGGGAAEATRAVNEALAPLVTYWQSRDQQSRDVLISQIETTGKIPGELAPFVVQLLLGL